MLQIKEDMQFHEFANLFPMMNTEEMSGLVEDMCQNGYDETSPIITYEGKILDGRNRYKAAQTASVEPVYSEFDGTDPLGFVIRHNLHRRHLNESQRGVIASRLANMNRGGDRPSRRDVNFDSANLQNRNQNVSQERAAEMMNVSPRTVATIKAIEKTAPELIEKIESGELTANKAWTEARRKEVVRNLESVEVQEAKAVEGVYDVIVIDPPWKVEKIEREVAPNQVAFDYPTMSLEEISKIEIHAADNCHVWLWTTQKYLPHAFGLFAAWNVKYICTFGWHKNGGFQPFGLPQYNEEFCLYGHIGSPQFVSTKDFKTCFNAPRGAHSEKPGEFYDTVRRVTAGRRLDMFNRRKIQGFDGWGKEAK